MKRTADRSSLNEIGRLSLIRRSMSSQPRPAQPAQPTRKPSKGTPTATKNTSAATTPSQSRPASPAPQQPSLQHDLATLTNLPLELTLIPSGELPQRTVTGTLWTYDPTTSLVVLSTASSTAPSNPTTAQNPPSQKRSYHLVKTNQIKSVVVLSTTPSPDSVSLPPLDQLRATPPAELKARLDKAVRADMAERARVGKGVSEEAQALFDALGRTLPVRWHNTSMVVMDEVIISAPYGVKNVQGGKGAGERIERVRKVVSPESLVRLLVCANDVCGFSWKESA